MGARHTHPHPCPANTPGAALVTIDTAAATSTLATTTTTTTVTAATTTADNTAVTPTTAITTDTTTITTTTTPATTTQFSPPYVAETTTTTTTDRTTTAATTTRRPVTVGEMGCRLFLCCASVVKCLVLFGCLCSECCSSAAASQPRVLPFPAHGLSQPLRPSLSQPPGPPTIGVTYPYVCPHEVTLSKVQFNQTPIDYTQFISYAVELPAINGFTMHYWFSLDDASTTSTMFNYGLDRIKQNNDLTVQLEVSRSGQQFFTVQVKDETVTSAPVDSPIGTGEWHHALHSFSPATDEFSHFLDGRLIKTHHLPGRHNSLVVPGGGVALSGQHHNAGLNVGKDMGEGLNGWLTLFQLSSKPLGVLSHATKTVVARLSSQCTGELEGDLINWRTTPKKYFGGAMVNPSFSKVCGAF